MKNYILHIGLPKTATSVLQKFFFSKLQQPSICYNPSFLIDPLVQALILLDFKALTKDDIKLLKDVVEYQSEKIPQKSILLSCELLSQRLLQFNYVARADFIKSIFPSATITLVLRYQPVLLKSLYQQHISQNYFLTPEEVFIPFSKQIFRQKERWKETMQIDVKEWNYVETIKYFKDHYEKRFNVLFFENYFKNIQDIGREVLAFSGFHVDSGILNSPLPKVNISYNSTSMGIILAIARRKLAFHPNVGFDSQHIQDLMEQYKQARFIFDAISVGDFLNRLKKRRHISHTVYSWSDKQLLRIIKGYSKIHGYIKPQGYELPESIGSYLERESKILNSSLGKIVDRQMIPKQYL